MEKISTENLICALLTLGFDKVDFLLYNNVIDFLSRDKCYTSMFEFIDGETSSVFKEYIEFDGMVFKFRDGYSFDSNISPINNKYLSLGSLLIINDKLIRFLKCTDFRTVIIKKLYNIGCQCEFDSNLNDIHYLFSNKEKDIICDLLRINKNAKCDKLPHIINMLSREEMEKYNKEDMKNRILTFK